MKRPLLVALLLVVLGPACKTAAPPAPPGPAMLPEPFGEYPGEVRILPGVGDDQTIRVEPGKPRKAGSCDLAVHIRSVTLDEGRARFALDTIGLPQVGGQPGRCPKARPGLALFVEGVEGVAASEVRTRVDDVLQTPEIYLGSKGIAFDRPPGEVPTEIASQVPSAGATEQGLGRHVTAWPRALLSVDPWYHDSSGRVRQEGQVEVEVVVGTDGRAYEPRIRTGMGSSHEHAVLRVLPLWRFEPARREGGPVAARILLHPALRIF
jgi:TonB family protein